MEIEATSIEHAIQIALEGLQAGKWDLFRGQTNSDWDVTSSAERLSEPQRREALERFKRFAGWAQNVEGMARYFSKPDSLWAIAQHYGLPTNFIDFSDDPHVAAFFASDTRIEPLAGQTACIVCLNSKDFARFWKESGPVLFKNLEQIHYPSFIRINIDNLWRLQQQKGSFLWNAIVGIERFYEFDRIVFPYVRDSPVLPVSDEIYPIHQSQLEKLLTQFFMNEQMRERNQTISSFNIAKFTIETTAGQYDATSWWPNGIARSADWNQSDAWQVESVEHSSAVLPGVAIELATVTTLADLCRSLGSILVLDFIEANRGLTLDIRNPGPLPADFERLLRGIRRLWNGMRTLPYESSEISTAIRRALELFPIVKGTSSARHALGEEGLYIEMASEADGNGAYSRAAITRDAFINASNPDFLSAGRRRLEALDPAARSMTDAALAEKYLLLAGRPWERLTLSGLRNLMIEQIVPTQIAWRVASKEADLRTVIYFSPVEFKVFGLA